MGVTPLKIDETPGGNQGFPTNVDPSSDVLCFAGIDFEDLGTHLINISGGDLQFQDPNAGGPLTLSELAESGKTQIVISLIGSVGGIFGGAELPYVQNATATPTLKARFVFQGTDELGAPSAIKIIAAQVGGGTGTVTINDGTNANTIASNAAITNAAFQIIDLGAISNLPTGEAIFELLLSETGGGTIQVSSVILEF